MQELFVVASVNPADIQHLPQLAVVVYRGRAREEPGAISAMNQAAFAKYDFSTPGFATTQVVRLVENNHVPHILRAPAH